MQVVKREILQTLFYSCALCHVHVTICFLYMTSVLCRILVPHYIMSQVQFLYILFLGKIYNISTLLENINFIWTSFSFRNGFRIFFSVSQRLQINFIFKDKVGILCFYSALSKVPKPPSKIHWNEKNGSF